VPVSVFEGDEAGAADACDGVGAGYAALGEQVAEAVGAVRLLVPRREALARQRGVAVGASEALAVPRLVLVRHATGRNDLVALDATSSELLLVAARAVYLLFARDEGLGADGSLTDDAAEAFLMPLASLVFHLLVACPEYLGAAVAPRGKLRIVAGSAIDLLHLAAKLLVDKRHRTLAA